MDMSFYLKSRFEATDAEIEKLTKMFGELDNCFLKTLLESLVLIRLSSISKRLDNLENKNEQHRS